MTRPVEEELLVFISSTITECSAERTVAREAIKSLNFEPVLFEEIGARPYPPRDLYRIRLESSKVFVGIYRHSYGFIAPGVAISGIEDEFDLATARKMDRLIYVYADPQGRDPRLARLISRVETAGLTVAKYANPQDLYDRLRDDVAALVATRFMSAQHFEWVPADASDVLVSLVPDPKHRLRRAALESLFEKQLSRDNLIVVTGPIGAGKTVFVAQVCTLHSGWLYVDARGSSFSETLRRCLAVLVPEDLETTTSLGDEPRLIARLTQQWTQLGGATLVVDGVSDAGRLGDALSSCLSEARRLVIIPKGAPELSSKYDFGIPPLTPSEIGEFVRQIRGQSPLENDLLVLDSRSKGNPLYLRLYASGQSGEIEQTLRDLELREWRMLDADAREIMTYLVLSPRPLNLSSLTALVTGSAGSAEVIAGAIDRCAFLHRKSHQFLEPVHDHLKNTLADELATDSVRLGFYSARLGDLLDKNGNYMDAFLVLDRAGQTERANALIELASTEAVVSGVGSRAVPIFDRQIELARAGGNREQEIRGLLAKAAASIAMGSPSSAQAALAEGKQTASDMDDPWWSARVAEFELEMNLRITTSRDTLVEVVNLKNQYEQKQDTFNAARLSVVLAVEYLGSGEAVKARAAAEEALSTFEKFGDEYGVRVARYNLLSALSAIPEEHARAFLMMQDIAKQIDPDRQPRERAMLCNMLARRYRQLGNPELAGTYAAEAIEIAERLGDIRLAALNRINLGNTFRDRGLLDEALLEYKRADQAAHSASAPRLEASANEVIASVFNEQGQYKLALAHADHAIALSSDSTDQLTHARALEERGIAMESVREYSNAVDSFSDAARIVQEIVGEADYFANLYLAAVRATIAGKHPNKLRDVLATITGVKENKQVLLALRDSLPYFAARMEPEQLLSVVATPFSFAMRSVAKPIERVVAFESLSLLAARSTEASTEQRLAAIIGVMLGCDYSGFSAFTLTYIAEQIAALAPGLHYKPHPDGAPHWTVLLPMTEPVICSVDQLDDHPSVAAVAMLLALLLRTFAKRIDKLLGTSEFQRTEFQINVVSEEEFVAMIDKDRKFIGAIMEDSFVVSESTDLASLDQPPIVVILRKDFGRRWQPERDFVSDVHLLLARVLEVAVDHLYAQRIDRESLRLKLVSFVRSLGSKMEYPVAA